MTMRTSIEHEQQARRRAVPLDRQHMRRIEPQPFFMAFKAPSFIPNAVTGFFDDAAMLHRPPPGFRTAEKIGPTWWWTRLPGE